MAVVGDQQQGAFEGLEPGLEPFHLLGVKVVRRFIQHQHVRLFEPGLGQGHAFPPPTGQGFHLRIQIHQTPSGGGSFQPGCEIPTPVIQAVLDGLQFVKEPGFCLGPGTVQAVVDLPMPGQEGRVVRQGRFKGLADTGSWREMRLLAEASDPEALGDHHGARIGCFVTGQQAEKGALACAIAADEPDLLVLEETETQSVQNGCRAISFRDIDQTQGDRRQERLLGPSRIPWMG